MPAWLTVLAALAVLSPAPGLGMQTAAAAQSDTDRPLVIARDLAVSSLDPAKAFCNTCQIYLSAVYETLVGLAPDNKTIVPRLAKSWEVNANQTVFTMHLDPGAVFADGTPVVAKDVRWSLERLHNLKSGPAFLMDGIEKIEEPDPHTVVITLSAPNSDFLGILTAPYTGVINSELAGKNGATAAADAATADTAESWLLANSAGSGPYVLTSYKPNDELRLERSENYWGKKPAIGTVIIRQIKDAVAQAQLLESGGADIAMQIDPDTAKTISTKDIVKQVLPSNNYLYLGISPGAKNATVPLTRDVRKAIGYALSYQQIIDLTVGGQGRMQASAIPNGFPGSEGLPDP
jgi:peptide/nickel transport system substrate-binding protein